jgi:cytochrome P450
VTTEAARPLAPEEFDPVSEQGFRDPASIVARAQRESPVFFHPPLGVWVVTRREDVEASITDARTFSSLVNGGSIPVPAAFADRVAPSLMAGAFLGMDPPEHTPVRKAGQRGFTRPRVAALEPRIAAVATELVDGFAAGEGCELMGSYCIELTTRTLMAMLDLPARDEEMFRALRLDHFLVMASPRAPMPEPQRSEVWERYATAHERLRELADERAARPGDDVISAMATAVDGAGERLLTRERVALHVCELAAAGTDTTAQLIANAVLFLSEHPEVLSEALAEPRLWANVVEETLRRRGSATFVSRQATRDVQLSGVTIPAGDLVWFSLAGAGNDPAHYDDPQRWDVHRAKPDDHVAFGKGRHFCLGAPIARAEATIGLQVLFERLPSLRAVLDAPLDFEPIPILPMRRTLPVRWS